MKKEIAELDIQILTQIRQNIAEFLEHSANKYDDPNKLTLDIAPQIHEGAKAYFKKSKIETLDIDQNSNATYIADLCMNNSNIIESEKFDLIICTEVLEHTLQPFNAIDEIERLLKPGGIALITTPFNFRIHGPLPDCWRFTIHGLKALFKNFEVLSINELEFEDRFLMPIHYTSTIMKKFDKI